METKFSPSEKAPTSALPSSIPISLQMASARGRLELPEKILISLPCAIISDILSFLFLFIISRFRDHFLLLRRLAAHCFLTTCTLRAMARESAGTSLVMVLPAAV